MTAQAQAPVFDHFIDGERSRPALGQYLDVRNPATGQVIARCAAGSAEDVDAAVRVAKRAFQDPAWRKLGPLQRAALLLQIAELIDQNLMELIGLEVASVGSTITQNAVIGPAVAYTFRAYAELLLDYPFVASLPTMMVPERQHAQIVKEPIGVCGLITPWNVPMLLFGWKVAPALAAGNTIVLKPSELTPLSTLRLAEIASTVLPRGVLNVVNGYGEVVGEAMSLHPEVAKISFTGSTRVGKRIQRNASETLKRVSLELGGKGPVIVMPDVDLNLAAQGALFGVMVNAGQACESGTRLIVHESIHDDLLERLQAVAARLVVGDPTSFGTSLGAVSSKAHFDRIMGHIRAATEQGARVICGGRAMVVAGCEGGHFVEPTILADVTNDMPVAREEIFGPVLAVLKFRTTAEAIAIANDTSYGLAAGIWTGDVVKAQEIADELQAGMVWVNDWHVMRPDAPFGGYKQSGLGRENGVMGLEAFLETKVTVTSFERDPAKKLAFRMLYR